MNILSIYISYNDQIINDFAIVYAILDIPIYISYNDQIINDIEYLIKTELWFIYISYNDQIINFMEIAREVDNYQFTFHIMIRL